MGAMQTIVVNIVILGLMVFVCGVVSRSRKDDRLTSWRAGWIYILAHYVVQLARPSTPAGQHLQAFALSGTLAFAGIFFILSTMLLVRGRKAGLRLGLVISLTTIPVLGLVAFGVRNVWLLSFVLVARQTVTILSTLKIRRDRRRAILLPITAVAASVLAFYGVFHGDPSLVSLALVSELFLAAAIGFCFNDWEPTVGLRTMTLGMAAWSVAFPIEYAVQALWPGLAINSEIWRLPAFCAAAGMILLVLEEDAHAAHRLSDEYQLVFESNPHPLWIFESEAKRFVAVNQATLALHGYTRKEFLNLSLADVLDPTSEPTAEIHTTPSGPLTLRSVRHRRKNGTIVPLEVQAHDILFKGKQCRFVLGLDVSEREALQKQLVRQAHHDALTGLSNRMLFEEQLADAVTRTTDAREKLAIICLDICRFKYINDLYGPRVGDECIKRVANILRSSMKTTDFVARTGGDEFALVLCGVKNAGAAEQIATGLREQFQEPMMIQGYPIQFSFSMGLAICPDDGTNAVTLWRGAENVLRRAQAAGGGQVIWLSPELRAEAEQQVEIEASMRIKMEEAGFHLAYQPLYSFEGRIRGIEALIRLDHATYGPVSPGKVIPIAEESGLIIQLGMWVVEQVCRQLRMWMDDGLHVVPVAINVSAVQLMHADFAERVMEALTRYHIDPRWIHLEVTETAAMRNLKEVSGQMDKLSLAGISFSIDDFGTGHSSLGRLNQLPISVLKIDRSFIEQLSGSKENCATLTIVQAILSMAHALGQKVVAEGVETPVQLEILRDLNCDLLQGFLLSRPVPPKEIPALLSGVHPAFLEAAPIEPPAAFSEKM